MADDTFAGPSLGYAWPIALSSFVDKPQYTITAHCNQISYGYANQLINLYADVGDQGAGRDFSASALFRPRVGLLLAVRYIRMPKTVAGRYYQQRFGLALTEESFQKYCGGRFEAIPNPFEDLDNKLFEELETPDSIDLENHIQQKYGYSTQEQNRIWLQEDVNEIVKLRSLAQRPQLLEDYLSVLASESPLIVHGLDQNEAKRLETLFAIRPFLPLQTRSYLTFVSNVLQPESVWNKATFLGLGYGLSVSGTMRSEAHTCDSSSGTFVKGPDSEAATKTASNLMDALLQLPPEQYLQNADGYLDNLPVDNDAQQDKMQRIWQLGVHYRGMVVREFGDSKSATDYLEEYCFKLSNSSQQMEIVGYVLDKCVEEQNVDNLSRTVRILAGNETSLIASSPSINLPDEVSKRMEPIIASGEFSLVNVVDFASEVWSESKSQQNPWSNLLIELVSQSASNQAISELEPLNRLFDPDQLLGVEANSSRFFGRVIQKTEDANLRATFISSTLRGLKSVEGVSAFIHELDEETLPWHLSMFRSVLDKSDNIWEFLLSSVDNNDGLLRPTAIAEYVGCALLISPELMVPSSFWQRLLDRHLSEEIQQQDILGLLRLFLLGDNLHERLDWQPETLDVLVILIPESDYELAGPMLEIPPSFSPAVYKKAASDLAEGSKTGKLPEVIPKLTDSLGLVQGEGLRNSLEFISLLASNIRQGSNSQFDPLIDQALHRIKTSETELLLGGKLETIAGELEKYFGRDAQWLVWFKQMTTLLKGQEFTSLSLALSQMMGRDLRWDDAVRQGTSLWLEKGVKNTGEAEGLLKQWFSTMIDSEKFEEIQNVIPPIVRSFVQPGENNKITDTFFSLVKHAWGDIHELTKFFNGRYWLPMQPNLITYVTQSNLRNALAYMAYYLHHQGNAGSRLEKITATVYTDLDISSSSHDANPTNLVGKSRYTEISNAVIATLILHEAQSVLEDKSIGIPVNVKSGISRGIEYAWNPNYDRFKSDINVMVRGNKKPEPTLDDLFRWWF